MIAELITEGRELRAQIRRDIGSFVRDVPDDAVTLWEAKTRGTLTRIYGDSAIELTRWDNVASQFQLRFGRSEEELKQAADYLREATGLLTEIHFAAPEHSSVNVSSSGPGPLRGSGGRVFLIHGHDERNLLRLKELLRDRFGLQPVVLMDRPGEGRTVIEKFEVEAESCEFAFALLTADDQVVSSDGEYTQARPNVVFELGWFYGKLGRDRVVILMQRGTKLHSDLLGIEHYEFSSDIREQALKIEDELARAGLVERSKRRGLKA